MTKRLPIPIVLLLVGLAAARVLMVSWQAVDRTRGDFYASMPGGYVQTINPTLWNSPDMADAWGYHRDTYFHGPVQYLTLYPLAFFDSFAAIASFLLPLYAVLLAGAFWMLWRTARLLGASRDLFAPLLAAACLFLPLLQAYLQREFEVVIFAALAASLYLLVNDRRSASAALMAYVSWFKYIPVALFAGYLVFRRWWRGLAMFAAVSVVVLIASELLFGLSRFFNNNVPGHAANAITLWGYDFRVDATGHLYGTGFCEGWVDTQSSLTNIRHGLCTLASRHGWVHPPLIYIALCGLIAAFYIREHARLERAGGAIDEPRRRAVEFSIVTTISTCFFFGHYYYLIALLIPLGVLLAVYVSERRPRAVVAWGAAYFLLGAFIVPVGVLSRATGYDVWAFYVRHAFFWYGEVLLMILLLNEYRRVAARV